MSNPALEELGSIPLFASLSRAQLAAASKYFHVRSYAKGAVVANEGDRLDNLNFILGGNVQAFWRDEAGHQLKLGIDGPGDHFPDVVLGGELALVSHIAVTDLRVAFIRITDLKQMLRRHPDCAVQLLQDVVARLRRMLQRTKTLTMQDVYGRVVKLLAARHADAPDRDAAGPLTHAEIGQRIGATREMVGRVLRDLAKGGYIKSGRGRITIIKKLPSRW